MAFDTSGSKKLPRTTIVGKLISLSFDSEKCAEQARTYKKPFDSEKGKFPFMKMALIEPGKTTQKQNGDEIQIIPVWANLSLINVDYEEMKELERADNLLQEDSEFNHGKKKHPLISVEYYETISEPKTDRPEDYEYIDEKDPENPGQKVRVKQKKKFANKKCTSDDIKSTFKILEDDVPDASGDSIKREKEEIEEEIVA